MNRQYLTIFLIALIFVGATWYAVYHSPFAVVYAQTDNETTSSSPDYATEITSAVNLIIELIIALIPALLVLKLIDKIFGGLFSRRGGGSLFIAKLKAYASNIGYLSLAAIPMYILETSSDQLTIDLSFLYPLIEIILLFAILGAIMKMMDRMATNMGGR